MSNDVLRALAILATFPAGATPYFYCFWRWFDFWRRHVYLTFALMLVMIGGLIAALVVLRARVFDPALDMTWPVQAIGWALIAITFVLAVVADRQLGIRVRSFLPFFEPDGTSALAKNDPGVLAESDPGQRVSRGWYGSVDGGRTSATTMHGVSALVRARSIGAAPVRMQ